MYRRGEELLGRYVTELPQPEPSPARILLINNSSLPFTEARTNSLGVMHKAIIVTPNEAERRIVNSTMLVAEGEEIAAEKQEEFVRTDKITRSARRCIERLRPEIGGPFPVTRPPIPPSTFAPARTAPASSWNHPSP